jgi:hypothetical protein
MFFPFYALATQSIEHEVHDGGFAGTVLPVDDVHTLVEALVVDGNSASVHSKTPQPHVWM